MLARLVVAVVLSSAVALAVEPDAAGCADHPLLTRMAGYRIVRCKVAEFDALPFLDSTGREGTVEGKLTQIVYGLPEGETGRSTVQVIRNYKAAFETKGGRLVYLNSDGALAYLTATKDGRPLWAVVNAYNPADVVLTVVESDAMRQDVAADVDPRTSGLRVTGPLAPAPVSSQLTTQLATPRPTPTDPATQRAPSGSRCVIGGITPDTAPDGAPLTLSGIGLDAGCVVTFITPAGMVRAQIVGQPEPASLRVWTPHLDPGTRARVAVAPAGVDPTSANVVGFTALGPDCSASALSRATVRWGETVTITGHRLDQGCGVELAPDGGSGGPPPPPVRVVSATASTIEVEIPEFTPVGPRELVVVGPSRFGRAGARIPRPLRVLLPTGTSTLPPCYPVAVQSISLPGAALPLGIAQEVIVWGAGMSMQCWFEFINLAHNVERRAISAGPRSMSLENGLLDASRIGVLVPEIPAGPATIAGWLGDRNSATVSLNQRITFTVPMLTPVLEGVDPARGNPGERIVLRGERFVPPQRGGEAARVGWEDLRAVLEAQGRTTELVPRFTGSDGHPQQVEVVLPRWGAVNVDGTIKLVRRDASGRTVSSAALPFKFGGQPTAAVDVTSSGLAAYDAGLGGAPEPRSTLDPNRAPPPTSDWTPPALDATANPVRVEETVLVNEGWERDSPQ